MSIIVMTNVEKLLENEEVILVQVGKVITKNKNFRN